MWHWFVAQNGIKDLVALGLGTVWGFVLGRAMRYGHLLKIIADRLDASTPGGLGDLVEHGDADDDDIKKKFMFGHIKGGKVK